MRGGLAALFIKSPLRPLPSGQKYPLTIFSKTFNHLSISLNTFTINKIFCELMNRQIAYKYRFYPTDDQKVLLAQTFGCVRYVYNNILEYRHKEYYQNNNCINYVQTSAKFTEMRKETQWLQAVSFDAIQQGLRNLDRAFSNFFKGQNKYPKFKNRNARQSFRLTKNSFRFKDGKLYIAKSKEPLEIKWSRDLDLSKINSITVSQDSANRYFVSIQGEKDIKLKPVNQNKIGIDLGLTNFIIDSNGNKIANPRNTKKYAQKLKIEQRKLSKKQKGSENFKKQKLKVARAHAKIADCRKDFLHKLSTNIVNENQVIILEDLAIKNMVQNRKLSKSISDAAWSMFVGMLKYKSEWFGRTFHQVNRWYPSYKTCSSCGHLHSKMPLSVRKFSCENCGTELDRDINAAKNILTVGHTELACGVQNKTKALKSNAQDRETRILFL